MTDRDSALTSALLTDFPNLFSRADLAVWIWVDTRLDRKSLVTSETFPLPWLVDKFFGYLFNLVTQP